MNDAATEASQRLSEIECLRSIAGSIGRLERCMSVIMLAIEPAVEQAILFREHREKKWETAYAEFMDGEESRHGPCPKEIKRDLYRSAISADDGGRQTLHIDDSVCDGPFDGWSFVGGRKPEHWWFWQCRPPWKEGTKKRRLYNNWLRRKQQK